MSGGCLECKYCLRKDFLSARGLSQHQDQSKPCKAKKQADFSKDSGYHTAMNSWFVFLLYGQMAALMLGL